MQRLKTILCFDGTLLPVNNRSSSSSTKAEIVRHRQIMAPTRELTFLSRALSSMRTYGVGYLLKRCMRAKETAGRQADAREKKEVDDERIKESESERRKREIGRT
jgi:hypothetical protein